MQSISLGFLSTFCLIVAACGGDSSERDIDAGSTDGPSGVCPTHIDLESLGDLTRIDIGYTGIAHGGNLPANTFGTYKLSDCDEDCRRCKFSGPVDADPARRPVSFHRCVDDPRTVCQTDDDCGSGDKCRFQLRTTSTNVANLCSSAYFEPVPGFGDGEPVQGTIDLVTGAASLSIVNLRTTTYGDDACQVCENDTTAFDGNPDGTCSVTGEDCDVHGSGGGGGVPSFVTSYDCPEGPISADAPLPLRALSSASQTWTLDASRPDCTGPGAEGTSCWCGVCEDFTPCFEDSQCATGTCGYAGTPETPINTYNNLCDPDSMCAYDEQSDFGTCFSTALGGRTVPCFPRSGSISVQGGVEVGDGFFISTLSGLECFPATGSASDQVFGLPGILYVKNVYRITPITIP